ncbi:hypothetical protein [Paenibacillus sedimenti]|uniref:Uncharacterized protein n=1 Tax=Paenibacillus sedimenti TaxID=2770274 RepID=A0A926QMQ8_9BACL|nr:hypothetical protein [Paenibacillus sedimenti]MBD0384910.1 hypothetical protein [Paenibacillus sedimenti]
MSNLTPIDGFQRWIELTEYDSEMIVTRAGTSATCSKSLNLPVGPKK